MDQKMEKIAELKNEKVKIKFNEATGRCRYNVPYEYKTIKIVLDNMDMIMFRRLMIKNGRNNYVCDGTPSRRMIDECISVQFHVEHTYEIFEMIGQCGWGGWNECPEYTTMASKAQEWQEQYSAELEEISHDSLKFQCRRRLSEGEAEALWNEICQISPNSQDLEGNGPQRILECREFDLWWD